MTLVSGFKFTMGESSCGCFGAIQIPPLVTLVFNILALLLIVRLRANSFLAPTGWSAFLRRSVARVVLSCGAAVGFSFVWFGSPWYALMSLSGEKLAIDSTHIELGDCPAGDKRTVEVRVTNITAEPATIVGVQTTCNCLVPHGLPMTIPPQTTNVVAFTLFFPRTPGATYEQEARFFIGGTTLGVAIVSFSGVVQSPEAIAYDTASHDLTAKVAVAPNVR